MKKTAKPANKNSAKAVAKKAPAKAAVPSKSDKKSVSDKKIVAKTKAKPAKADPAPKKQEIKAKAKPAPNAAVKKAVSKENKTSANSNKQVASNKSEKNLKEKEIKKTSTVKSVNTVVSPKKDSKKAKKSKASDGEEGFEEVDLEQLLKDAVPVVKKKGKIPQKQKPIEIDEYEEFKRPSFNAKSLTQAIAGPPSAPPKAEPVSKIKGKFLKFELEYLVRSSVRLLYEFLSTPSGLSEWFADDVNFRNDIYSFFWDKAEQKAKLVKAIENKCVRFQWIDENKEIYFEFRIEVDDLTGDVALIIADFAEDDLSKDAATLLWNSQVESLLKAIGSY